MTSPQMAIALIRLFRFGGRMPRDQIPQGTIDALCARKCVLATHGEVRITEAGQRRVRAALAVIGGGL